jgi:hypothetical protein
VDDRARTTHELTQRNGVGEVAERDLHPHAVGAEAARIPHQHPHRLSLGQQAPEQSRSHEARGSSQNDHVAIISKVANVSWVRPWRAFVARRTFARPLDSQEYAPVENGSLLSTHRKALKEST